MGQGLQSVSDTALLVAHHRALESARPDALFRDTFAQRLVGKRGEEIARKLPWGRRMAWSTIVRTALIDAIVTRLAGQGVDTVLNLAAGLDSRPYRLDLPASLRWVEMDLPAMTSAKDEMLAQDVPRCTLERMAVDLANHAARRGALEKQLAGAKRVLVITEGLLIYLSPQTVAELGRDLHSQPAFQHWVLDIASPFVLKRTRKWWAKQMKAANVDMQFGPAEGTKFFAPLGWGETEFHDLFLNSLKLSRPMPMAWVLKVQMKLLPKRTARNLEKWKSGVALLQRK